MKIRWGVIGAGGFADKKAIPGLLRAQNAIVQAVMVRDRERAQALARKHGVPEAYDSVEALLNSSNIDAVYICTPVDLHRSHVEAAAAAGKHILCEKPMAMDIGDCVAMIQICKRYGVHLGVGYMMRYRPHVGIAKRWIQEGRLGQLILGRAQNVFWYSDTPHAWRLDPIRGKGGVLADVGSHCIDTLRFLMGEVVEVQGMARSLHFPQPIEDTAVALLRFENKSLGIVDCSYAIPNRECPLEIYGTKGSLLITRGLGPFADPLMRLLTEEKIQEISIPSFDNYTIEFEMVSQAFIEGREPEVNGWEGLRITEILLEMLRSVRQTKILTPK